LHGGESWLSEDLLATFFFKSGVVSHSIRGKIADFLFFCSSDTVAQLMENILGVKINWAGIAVSIAPPLFFLMHWKQSSNESSLSSLSAMGNQIKASSEKPVPLDKHCSQNSPFLHCALTAV